MTEKATTEDIGATYDEKKVADAPEPELADLAGRRRSVALNIVENPLKVSFARFALLDLRHLPWPFWASTLILLTPTAHLSGADGRQCSGLRRVAWHARARLSVRSRCSGCPRAGPIEMLEEIDETERTALAYERDHKWHGPKMLWYSISLCAIGAATQGWDQTGSNGVINALFPALCSTH